MDPFADDEDIVRIYRGGAPETTSNGEPKLTDPEVKAAIEREVQLRVQIAMLEKEAEAKKKAAEKAVRDATAALNEVKQEKSNSVDVPEVSGKEGSSEADIDAIAQVIRTAESMASEAGDDATDDPVATSPDPETSAAAPAVSTTRTEDRIEESREDKVPSPPTIVRKSEGDAFPNTQNATVKSKASAESDTTQHTSNMSKREEALQTTLRVVTSNLSNLESSGDPTSPSHQETWEALQAVTSNLSMEDPTEHMQGEEDTDNKQATIEDTLAALLTKINECTQVLADRSASAEEKVEAAKLAATYAKTANALRKL